MAHPGGRPTKYKLEYCEEAISFLAQGFSKEALAGHLEVSAETLYNWMEKFPEFLEAIKKGETRCRLHWEELGHDMVLSGQGQAAVYIFSMKNRFGWKDVQEVQANVNNTQPVVNIITYGQQDPLLSYLSTKLQSRGIKSPSFTSFAGPAQISGSQLAPQSKEDNAGDKPAN